jgi:RHS repeat-associated protein
LTAAPGGITYAYDAEGNLIAETAGSTTTTFSYDYRDRLTGVTIKSGGGTTVETYTYDALDRRIGVDANGTQTWTVYDGQHPYADFNSSGAVQDRYVYGPGVVDGAVVDEILARVDSGGNTAWYLTDHLGSVRDLVSSSGTVLDHIVYDSFGNILSESNAANGDRFKYAGMQYDGTTGLSYDQARWYDPVTGRFISRDPSGFGGGDANLYRYVGNGPTDAIDPSGAQADRRPLNPIIVNPNNTGVLIGPDPMGPDGRPVPGYLSHKAYDYYYHYIKKIPLKNIKHFDDPQSYDKAIKELVALKLKYPQVIYHTHSRPGSLYFYKGDPNKPENRLSFMGPNYLHFLENTMQLYPSRVSVIGCDFYTTDDAKYFVDVAARFWTYGLYDPSGITFAFGFWGYASIPVYGSSAHVETISGQEFFTEGKGYMEENHGVQATAK